MTDDASHELPDRETVLAGNRAVHAQLAVTGEYGKSPHFRPENQARVRAELLALVDTLPNGAGRLLDFGCGTGFVVGLVADAFEQVIGVDITREMIAEVDRDPGRVDVAMSLAEATPFADATFDMATAYSFLDHLHDYRQVLAEAARVLRPGGVFHAGLNPNRHFTDNLRPLEGFAELPETVAREVRSMLHNGEHYAAEYQIDAALLDAAEPVKSAGGGFAPEEVVAAARECGFADASYRFEWFLGQAGYLHGRPDADLAVVETFLRESLPATRGLFKYVTFVCRR